MTSQASHTCKASASASSRGVVAPDPFSTGASVKARPSAVSASGGTGTSRISVLSLSTSTWRANHTK